MNSQRTLYVVLGVVAVSIISVQAAAYYYYLQDLPAPVKVGSACPSQTKNGTTMTTVKVNMLVNYGNGTRSWYNETNIPSNWNAYSLTAYIVQCNLASTWYGPPLNEHLVTGIGGVSNRGRSSWTLWRLCETAEAWYFSNVGADNLGLMNGTTLAWAFQSDSSMPPIPGAKTTSSC